MISVLSPNKLTMHVRASIWLLTNTEFTKSLLQRRKGNWDRCCIKYVKCLYKAEISLICYAQEHYLQLISQFQKWNSHQLKILNVFYHLCLIKNWERTTSGNVLKPSLNLLQKKYWCSYMSLVAISERLNAAWYSDIVH